MGKLRAGFYIDGFNFYHAVDALNRNHYKWTSYRRLARLLIPRDEELAHVKLFTALAHHIPNAPYRHRRLLDALSAEDVQCLLGRFKRVRRHCKACQSTYDAYEEKESDVNIAIHVVADCYEDLVDVVYVVTSDTDIAPSVQMCKERFPKIQFVTVAPPNRRPIEDLVKLGCRSLAVSHRQIESALMEQEVILADGRVIKRPTEYDPPTA